MKKIYVHVADDHKILIEGIIALLNTEKDIEVTGYSLTGKEVINWYKQNKADILILDINMPELDGIGVLKVFKKRKAKHKTIILSGLSDPKLVQEMIALGASGFIEKATASEHIVSAIRTVNAGNPYYSDEIKKSLFDLYVNNTKSEEAIKSTSEEPLSDREIEILRLIIEEYSTSEISEKIDLSIKTVEFHRRNLYKKIKVKSIVGLAMYAVKNNIV